MQTNKMDKAISVYYNDSKYNIMAVLLPFKNLIRRIFFLSFLINILTVMVPVLIMFLIDGKVKLGISGNDLLNTLLVLAILCFNFLFRYIRAGIINVVLFNVDKTICSQILGKVFKIPAKKFEKKGESFWTTVFADIDVIRNGLSGSYIINIFDIPFVLLFIGTIGILLDKYFFVILVFILIYAIFIMVSSYMLGIVDDKEKLAVKERDELVSKTIHNLSSLKTLSITNKVMDMWQDYQRSIIDNTYKRNYTLDISLVFSFIIYFLGLMIFTLLGVYTPDGLMSVGVLVAILLLFSQNFYIINSFIKYLPEYFKFTNSTQRLAQVMAEQVEALKTEKIEDITLANIQLKEVSIEDSKKEHFLSKVDFTFNEGVPYLVRAGNPFLSSIFLKSLFGGYDISSGEVLFDRYDVSKLMMESLTSYIHYSSENYFVIEGSIKENLTCLTIYESGDKNFSGFIDYKMVAKDLGLDEIIAALPNGYNTVISSKTDILTPEELKLLSVARVFVGNPRVMLFDEPLIGLGPVSRGRFISLIEKLSAEKIILISTNENINIKNKVVLQIDKGNLDIVNIPSEVEEDTSQNRALFRRIFGKKE